MDRRETIEAVQRMQDFIENHLSEPITLKMLAKASGYSLWHSARLFKDLTGKPPFEYIRSRRLSQAALALRTDHLKVVDVAFDFVFDSHEGFTKAFSRQFGVSPRDYRKRKKQVELFMPGRVRDQYLITQEGVSKMQENPNVDTVFVQVVDRPGRKLILKRGVAASQYFEYCDEVGCEVWDMLCGIRDTLYEPIGMWLPDNLRRPGTSRYAQGVEVAADYNGEVPEGFEMIELKPCKMMVFQGQPYDDEKFLEAIGELWQVMNRYNPEVFGYCWADEDGPRFQLAPMGYRGYIEARPVRVLQR